MEDIITFEQVHYSLFKNLSFHLKKGSFTTIVGSIGSGKTTLVNMLLGFVDVEGSIVVDGLDLFKNKKKICEQIGMVLENPEEIFVAITVMDEIAFRLENQNKPKQEIYEKVNEMVHLLQIEHLLEKNPKQISASEKTLVALASALIINPKILIIDGTLQYLEEKEKKKIFEILKLKNEQGMTIINFTSTLEESLYGKDILLLHNGNIIKHDKKEVLLKEEHLLKKIGLEIPFLVDLSIRLMYYGVLDHIIFDMDEMVDIIWK